MVESLACMYTISIECSGITVAITVPGMSRRRVRVRGHWLDYIYKSFRPQVATNSRQEAHLERSHRWDKISFGAKTVGENLLRKKFSMDA